MPLDADILDRVTETVEQVRAQLTREHREREHTRALDVEQHQRAVAAEVDRDVLSQRAARRYTMTLILAGVPVLGGAFAWSYATVSTEHQRQIEDAKRLQVLNLGVNSATKVGEQTAKKLETHENDFDSFRYEQQSRDNVGRLERQHLSRMLERTLRSLGRRPPDKTPEHRDAIEALQKQTPAARPPGSSPRRR